MTGSKGKTAFVKIVGYTVGFVLIVCLNLNMSEDAKSSFFLRTNNDNNSNNNGLQQYYPSHRSLQNEGEQSEQQQEQEEERILWEKPQTFVGVINTPKCGTGGLTDSFVHAFNPCNPETRPYASTVQFDCPEQRNLVRAHNFDGAVEVYKSAREKHPVQKCFLVTAIRGPQTWLPSLFLQRYEERLCNAEISDKQEMIDLYHEWLMTENSQVREAVGSVRPKLFHEFGQTTLTEQMERVEQNGGFSVLRPPEDESSQSELFPNCDLLFLKMEDKEIWSDIIHRLMPGVRYERNRSRTEQCPNIAEHYRAIQEYTLTNEELNALIQEDAHTKEYFHVYGYHTTTTTEDDMSIAQSTA